MANRNFWRWLMQICRIIWAFVTRLLYSRKDDHAPVLPTLHVQQLELVPSTQPSSQKIKQLDLEAPSQRPREYIRSSCSIGVCVTDPSGQRSADIHDWKQDYRRESSPYRTLVHSSEFLANAYCFSLDDRRRRYPRYTKRESLQVCANWGALGVSMAELFSSKLDSSSPALDGESLRLAYDCNNPEMSSACSSSPLLAVAQGPETASANASPMLTAQPTDNQIELTTTPTEITEDSAKANAVAEAEPRHHVSPSPSEDTVTIVSPVEPQFNSLTLDLGGPVLDFTPIPYPSNVLSAVSGTLWDIPSFVVPEALPLSQATNSSPRKPFEPRQAPATSIHKEDPKMKGCMSVTPYYSTQLPCGNISEDYDNPTGAESSSHCLSGSSSYSQSPCYVNSSVIPKKPTPDRDRYRNAAYSRVLGSTSSTPRSPSPSLKFIATAQ